MVREEGSIAFREHILEFLELRRDVLDASSLYSAILGVLHREGVGSSGRVQDFANERL